MKKNTNRGPILCAALLVSLVAMPAFAQQLSGNETRGPRLSP